MSRIEGKFDSSISMRFLWPIAKDTTVQAEIIVTPVLPIVTLLAVRPKKSELVNFKLVILCHLSSDFLQTGTVNRKE